MPYGAPLSTLGPPRTQRLIERMARSCALGQGMKLPAIVGALALGQQLKRVDVVGTPPWGRLMRDNSIRPGAVAASGPLLMTQGAKDDIVAPAVTRDFAGAACRAGARLRFVQSPAAIMSARPRGPPT